MTPTYQKRTSEPVDLLLVEDDPGHARLLRRAFEEIDSDASIQVATNGSDALDHLQPADAAESSLPALVLVDLGLPGMDGHEVLQAIRDDPQLESLPVIVLTVSDDDEDIVRCYDANANAYLTKPADYGEFVTLAEALDRFWLGQARLPPTPG